MLSYLYISLGVSAAFSLLTTLFSLFFPLSALIKIFYYIGIVWSFMHYDGRHDLGTREMIIAGIFIAQAAEIAIVDFLTTSKRGCHTPPITAIIFSFVINIFSFIKYAWVNSIPLFFILSESVLSSEVPENMYDSIGWYTVQIGFVIRMYSQYLLPNASRRKYNIGMIGNIVIRCGVFAIIYPLLFKCDSAWVVLCVGSFICRTSLNVGDLLK